MSVGSTGVFETLRDQVPLSSLIDANGRNLSCIHPDHQDSNPSMRVYDDHIFCFGCGFHGDVVDVWSAQRGLQRPIDAALELAHEFNVTLPQLTPEARQEQQERREKQDRHAETARRCHEALRDHGNIREWWKSRGFGEELQSRFLLGASEDGSEAIIPFWHRGRVEGIIRRKLSGEPKYVYPKTEEFASGYRPLFVPATLNGDVYLVEGILDALALAALGQSAIRSEEHTSE